MAGPGPLGSGGGGGGTGGGVGDTGEGAGGGGTAASSTPSQPSSSPPSQHHKYLSHSTGAWRRGSTFLLLPVCTLWLFLLGRAGGTAGGAQENSSHPYGEIGYGYWAQGVTSYPCTSPEDCALMFNASDPLRDAILLEEDQDEVDSEPCIMTGHLAESVNWFGYLAIFQFKAAGGRVYYRFVYPEDRCCIKIIFYLEEQVLGLRARMNCLQKQSMVDPGSRQVILLSPSDTSAGCVSNKTDNGVRVIECTSGRVLKSNEDRNWYIAASSCGSPTGLDLQYSFVAYGHKGKCPEPTTTGGIASLHPSASRRPFSVAFDDVTARLLLVCAGALWSLWCRHIAWDAVR